MILAAEYIPSPLRLMLRVGRHSGIGNLSGIGSPVSRFLAGNGEGIPVFRFGRREAGNPRFPIRPGPGIGVPIRRFLVCHYPSGACPLELKFDSGCHSACGEIPHGQCVQCGSESTAGLAPLFSGRTGQRRLIMMPAGASAALCQ